MRKTALLSTVALLAGLGLASAQTSSGQEKQSGASPQAQSQLHEGKAAQQQTTGQARHEQGSAQNLPGKSGTENMPGKSGAAAQAQPEHNQNKREQTTGQNVQKGKESAGNRAERNLDHTTGQGAASQAQPSQLPQKQGQQTQQGSQGRSGQSAQQRQLSPQQGQATTGAGSQQQTAQPSGQSGQTSGAAGRSGQAGNATVTLNESQRARIQQTVFARSDVPRVDHVNFSLVVGTIVPESVHVVVVPETLVEIRPEWREDMYFVTGDDIVIVDHSHRIVAIVAAGPRTAGYERGRNASAMHMTAAEIRQLQIALNAKGFNVGAPDGVFGIRTREALIAFQKQQGFQANGEIDQQTMTALGVNATTGSSSSTGQGGASNLNGQSGSNNLPASRSGQAKQSGSSTTGQGSQSGMPSQGSQSKMPSSSTPGQGLNQPSKNQSGGSTDLPSGQSR
jgi:hypothetical protein